MVESHSLKPFGDRFEMLLVSSSVNRLLKKSASTSAFSLSLVVLVSSPSSSVSTRSGMPCLIFVFLLTYWQNFLRVCLGLFCYVTFHFLFGLLVRFLLDYSVICIRCISHRDRVSMYRCQHLCFFLIFLIIFHHSGPYGVSSFFQWCSCWVCRCLWLLSRCFWTMSTGPEYL